jgi:hypothetical protein
MLCRLVTNLESRDLVGWNRVITLNGKATGIPSAAQWGKADPNTILQNNTFAKMKGSR